MLVDLTRCFAPPEDTFFRDVLEQFDLDVRELEQCQVSRTPGEAAENSLDTKLDLVEVSRAADIDTPDVETVKAWSDPL